MGIFQGLGFLGGSLGRLLEYPLGLYFRFILNSGQVIGRLGDLRIYSRPLQVFDRGKALALDILGDHFGIKELQEVVGAASF